MNLKLVQTTVTDQVCKDWISQSCNIPDVSDWYFWLAVPWAQSPQALLRHSFYFYFLLRFLFLHTLFFFELYFELYLIGTTISWSYLLILSFDHILSDRWSYLTDDLMFLYISLTCARHILWILLTCFRHVLHTAYARHSFPMLRISCLQHALLMTYACLPCCLHAYFTI